LLPSSAGMLLAVQAGQPLLAAATPAGMQALANAGLGPSATAAAAAAGGGAATRAPGVPGGPATGVLLQGSAPFVRPGLQLQQLGVLQTGMAGGNDGSKVRGKAPFKRCFAQDVFTLETEMDSILQCLCCRKRLCGVFCNSMLSGTPLAASPLPNDIFSPCHVDLHCCCCCCCM
jgi:hypothetical protein